MPKNSFPARDETLGVLQSSELFRDLEPQALGEILSRSSSLTWPRGRAVAAEDIRSDLHVILSGRVKVEQINEETGRAVTLFLLGPGDIFDILELLDGHPSDAIFEARDRLSLLAMPITEVRHWIRRHPEFNRAFLPYLGKMMRLLEGLAGDLALHDTETRLAHLIVRHLDAEEHNSLRLINDMSHEALAEMIGSVRAVVNRQLQHWRRQGIVSMQNGRIVIKRLEDLLRKAGRHHPEHRL